MFYPPDGQLQRAPGIVVQHVDDESFTPSFLFGTSSVRLYFFLPLWICLYLFGLVRYLQCLDVTKTTATAVDMWHVLLIRLCPLSVYVNVRYIYIYIFIHMYLIYT